MSIEVRGGVSAAVERRARRHAALGEPVRLAMVDDLAVTDRSPSELADRFDLPMNLLAHHLDALESAGLIERLASAGDGRRRYVRLRRDRLGDLAVQTTVPRGSVLFVCSQNSARSQLAAALWADRRGRPAASAGTHPARQVHPGAVAAAARVGLDLADARPRHVDHAPAADQVITVCDRAHEDLEPEPSWWHWSIPDPVATGTDDAFDAAVSALDERIRTLEPRKESP